MHQRTCARKYSGRSITGHTRLGCSVLGQRPSKAFRREALVPAPPSPDSATRCTAPRGDAAGSRRGIAILLLLSLVQFMDMLDASILNIALPSIKTTSASASRACSGSSTATSSPTAASCCSAAGWPTCSAAARPRHRPDRVRRLVADRRPRPLELAAGRRALRAGNRRRDALARRALDSDDHLPLDPRPQHRARRLGRRLGPRRRRRRSLRRAADRGPGLALGAVRQRPVQRGRLRRRLRLAQAERMRARLASFDALGALLVTGGMLLLVYALVKAPDVGWGTTRTIAELAAAGLILAAFVVNELRVAIRSSRSRSCASRASPSPTPRRWSPPAGFVPMFFFLTLYMQTVLALLADPDRHRVPAADGRLHHLGGDLVAALRDGSAPSRSSSPAP